MLHNQHQQVLALISAGSTVAAAAREAGVHRNTIGNWLRTPDFRKALEAARAEKALLYQDEAETIAAEALAALRAIIADPNVAPGIRVRAAIAMLDRAASLPPLPLPPQEEILKNVHKNAQASEPQAAGESGFPQPCNTSQMDENRNIPLHSVT